MTFTDPPDRNRISAAYSYAKDVAERAIATFVQAFMVIMGGSVLDLGDLANVATWQAAIAGGVAAVISLFKSAVAKFRGRETASLASGV